MGYPTQILLLMVLFSKINAASLSFDEPVTIAASGNHLAFMAHGNGIIATYESPDNANWYVRFLSDTAPSYAFISQYKNIMNGYALKSQVIMIRKEIQHLGCLYS